MGTLVIFLFLCSVFTGISGANVDSLSPPVSTSKSNRWIDVITEYVRGVLSAGWKGDSEGPINLDDGIIKGLPFPLLVLPIPVPFRSPEGFTRAEAVNNRFSQLSEEAHRNHQDHQSAEIGINTSGVISSRFNGISPYPIIADNSDEMLRHFEEQLAHIRSIRDNDGSNGFTYGDNKGYVYERGPSTRPVWNTSMYLRAELDVPYSDFEQSYELWYDGGSGSARTHFSTEGKRFYRSVQSDGSISRSTIIVNRLEETEFNQCQVTNAATPAAEDLRFPALPDMSNFQFSGYVTSEDSLLERWTLVMRGGPGELGAADIEELTVHHEVLVDRSKGKNLPVTYSVTTDSSVLGPKSDMYTHRFLEVHEMQPEPDMFKLDINQDCQTHDTLSPNIPEELAQLEPLREYTHLGRDPRHKEGLLNFQKKFNREYLDEKETTMRLNIFVTNSRFINNGNSEGSTFTLEANFLTERLDVELRLLNGIAEPDANVTPVEGADFVIEPFPHDRGDVNKISNELPKEFDWRTFGGVSQVRYQGMCPTCWAFAVAGAVEGALFVRTRRLVPLSEKCLVDCARPFGGNGCGRTWPRYAYNYVQAKGLPALDDYPPYKEKEDTCEERQHSPVTRISSYVNVTQNSVPALQVAIYNYGTPVVLVDAEHKSFIFYKAGMLNSKQCGKKSRRNHAVIAVGWGQLREKTYFILKNTWSDRWAEKGYIKVNGVDNICGILDQPSYPRLEDADILKLPSGGK